MMHVVSDESLTIIQIKPLF